MSLISPDEKIIIEIRKHFFYFYMNTVGIVIVSIVPLIVYYLFIDLILLSNPGAINIFLVFVYAILLMFLWIVIFITWTNYYMDVWIITDKRVVDFDLKSLFCRDIASVPLDKIVDVKVVISGFLEHMLKIGSIYIQTAGTDKEFEIRGIAEPEHMRTILLDAMNAYIPQQQSVPQPPQ